MHVISQKKLRDFWSLHQIGKPYLPIPSPLTRGISQKARLEGKFARFQRILSPKMAQFARFRYIARQWEIQG